MFLSSSVVNGLALNLYDPPSDKSYLCMPNHFLSEAYTLPTIVSKVSSLHLMSKIFINKRVRAVWLFYGVTSKHGFYHPQGFRVFVLSTNTLKLMRGSPLGEPDAYRSHEMKGELMFPK